MKSLDKQWKQLISSIEKELIEEVKKEEMRLIGNGFDFLDSESERLLFELIKDEAFPESLKQKFFDSEGNEISFKEQEKLRALIHELVSHSLITLKWGDNLPLFGRIEQKGRSYFERKQQYLMLINGSNIGFNYLDEESERILKELLSNKDFVNGPCFIVPNNYSASVIENLITQGYLDSERGVEFLSGGSYVCGARLTQKAKSYEEMKKRAEKHNKSTINNYYGPTGLFQGATISNSQIQIGTMESVQSLSVEYVEKTMKEFTDMVNKESLSEEQKGELADLIEDVLEKNKKEKPGLLKRALKSLWEFTKEVGASVLSAYLCAKFGFTGGNIS